MPRLLLCLGLASLAALANGRLLAQPPADAPPTVTGTVIDERGVAAADVEVVLRPYPSTYEADLYLLGSPDALPEAVGRTRSGPDGAFSLSAPLVGPYRLEFGTPAPADQPAGTGPDVYGLLGPLKGSQIAEPTEVPDRHRVTVRVLDNIGQPVQDALVIADPEVRRSPRYVGAMTRWIRDARAGKSSRLQARQLDPTYVRSASRTDAEGIARFAMPTDEAHVVVSAEGFTLGKAKTGSGRAALRLERAPGVRLRVRGPGGTPAPDVIVRALGGTDSTGSPLALTDHNGEALVARVHGSETAYELERADYAFARVSLPTRDSGEASSGEQVVDVQLEDALRIPGRVTDTASGLPIDGAAVWVQGFPGNNAYSGPTGAFDLNIRSAQRTRRLQVTAGGYVSETTDVAPSGSSIAVELRVGLTRTVPIRGLVTDDIGRPVAGAKIWAEPRGAGAIPNLSPDSGPATSADDGSFRVEHVVYDQTHRLTAQAPGYASTILDLPPVEPGLALEPVEIVLHPGLRAVGTVVDDEGNPVAAAHVALLWPLDQSDFRSSFDPPATEATTNDQGAFVFPAAAPGEYEMRVTHPEYAPRPPAQVEVPPGESDFDFGDLTLVAGAKIHGVVTDAGGEPVAEATVQARGQSRMDRSTARTAATDADGRFRLGGLSSELADLGVRAAGYPLLVRPGVRANNDEPIVIELVPGASLGGRVIDNGGNGVAGIPVRLAIERDYRAGGDPRLWEGTDMFPRGVTDDEGRFRFEHLVPGTWSAEAKHREEGAKLEAIELASGETREIELILGTPNRLTVIVTTSLGEPVADAVVQVQAEGAATPGDMGWTDGSGRTQVDISPGPAVVSVEHEKLRDESRQVQLSAGANELRVELHPGLEISGSVRSYHGAPLALATVEAVTEFSFDTDFHQANTVSDEGGAFRITGLEPGRYILTARAPGYADGGPDEPVEIDSGPLDGVEIVLEPGASIVGAVTGLGPSDLTQVAIRVWRNSRSRTATPDAEGSFSIEGVAPGTWRVIATKGDPGAERTVERTVTIEQGVTEVVVELPFERGLRLAGQVLEAGEPMVGGRLNAGAPGDRNRQSTQTDHQGNFVFEGLKPGPNQLVISRPDFSGMEFRSIDLQTDLEGVRIELEPATATVAGVVVDAETGQPLDFAQLAAADAATIGALAAGGDNQPLVASATASFSMNEGKFELELREDADRLLVTRGGYESVQIPLSIAPGEHREGLVIRLQASAPASPNQ